MQNQSDTVLVTGGAGYIGSHAVLELIAAAYRPVVLDDLSTGVRSAVPDGVPFYEGAVADGVLVADILKRHEIGAVMHFAASAVVPESVADPIMYYKNNTLGTLLLAEAALKGGVERFIFSSSAAVYGIPERMPIDEDSPTEPINPYGASKLMSERMLTDISAANPTFRPVSLRYFNVAGADPKGRSGQQGPSVTHLIRIAVGVALGHREVLEIYGHDYPTRDGTCERDYIHVADLAAAHVSALRYLERGGEPVILNCGCGRGFTINEVVAAMEEVIGRKLPVAIAPRRPGDPPSLIAAADRIGEVLDWKPVHADLPEIIASALAWQQKLDARG
jgi:UDP-glucose 4-epimerase